MNSKLLLPLSLCVLFGCSPKSDETKTTVIREVSQGVVSEARRVNTNGWDETLVDHNQAAGVRLIKYVMPPEQVQQHRDQYRSTDLQQYPMDISANARVFKFFNIEEYKNAAFLAPKVFAFGSSEHGKISVKEINDNKYSISFPIALVSGANKQIIAPDSTKINLPSEYVINESLIRESTKADKLGVLPGSLKKIIVKFADQEFDATPFADANADYSEIEKPFNVNITLDKKNAEFFTYHALPDNAAEVSVIYEVKARFTDSKFKLEFNREKLYRDIEARLKAKVGWADVEMRYHMREVIKNQTMNMSIVGDVDSIMNRVLEYAIDQFSEPFTEVGSSPMSECGGKVCLRLSYEKFSQKDSFNIEWNHSTTAQTGQHIIAFTQLKPLYAASVKIGVDGKEELRQNSSIETGITINEGDVVEIKPIKIKREQVILPDPNRTRTDNVVCLKSQAVYERRCVSWDMDCCGPRCSAVKNNNKCGRTCSEYKDVQVGSRCTQSENQWIDQISYSFSSPVLQELIDPVAQLEELYEGLAVKFTWDKKSVECPLSVFERRGDGQSLKIKLQNNEQCNAFIPTNKDQIMLHLVNHLSKPVSYKEGKLSVNWQGEILESPRENVFYPTNSLSLSISQNPIPF